MDSKMTDEEALSKVFGSLQIVFGGPQSKNSSAESANPSNKTTFKDDTNQPETETESLRAGALRLSKARQIQKAIRDRTLPSLRSPSNTQETTE